MLILAFTSGLEDKAFNESAKLVCRLRASLTVYITLRIVVYNDLQEPSSTAISVNEMICGASASAKMQIIVK